MAAELRNAARGLVISGRGVGVGLGISGRRLQRTPAVAAGEGRRLSPRFHGGPPASARRSPASPPIYVPRRHASSQPGEDGDRLTFDEKMRLCKRSGHLLFRLTKVVCELVISWYILKLGYILLFLGLEDCEREAASLMRKCRDKLLKRDDLLDDLIDKHASKRVDKNDEEDFIDVLLSVQQEYNLTRDNIKAVLMDMFEAGTDTTYIALDYAMAELMRKPQAMAKLQAEVRSCAAKGKDMVIQDDLGSLTYLKAVMKETLRLHPSGPLLVPHFSMADYEVDGYTIPSRHLGRE